MAQASGRPGLQAVARWADRTAELRVLRSGDTAVAARTRSAARRVRGQDRSKAHGRTAALATLSLVSVRFAARQPGSVRPVLRLRDLGPLCVEIERHGHVGEPQRVGGPKPERVLSALLMKANSRVSRDELVTAGWGDRSVAEVTGPLESLIWRLRGVLEPEHQRGAPWSVLVGDHGGYRLVLDPTEADSLRFAQLAEQGDAALATGDAMRAAERYALALDLWRDTPFQAVADQEWALTGLARLNELHGQVQEQYADALLRLGENDRALILLEQLMASSPLRERVWQLLMLARYRSGRVEESLAAYRRVRALLLDELGMEPGDELRDLHQRILCRDPGLAAAPGLSPVSATAAGEEARATAGSTPTHLPLTLTTLIGRQDELARLSRVLEQHRFVTVVGAGGCGKTRLAIETARRALSSSPDGVWFIDLTAAESPSAAVYSIASQLGVAAPATGDVMTSLRSYLLDRRLRLVLDNCEHLLPGLGPVVAHLLGADGESSVLATSREPLGVPGEVLWSLAPLPTRDTLGGEGTEIGATPAAQLFLARVAGLEPTLEATLDVAVVESICAALDGLPLAIELAAARIRSFGVQEILDQVTNSLADLSRIGSGGVSHHDTIDRSIEWSVRLLPEQESVAHARLSVLPGVFTVAAATAVVASEGIEPRSVPHLLSQLVHRSLLAVVRPTEPDRPTRYRQLATVRAHAERVLAATGQADAAIHARDGFIEKLVASHPDFERSDTNGWFPRVSDNHDTLTAVLQHSLVTEPDPRGVYLLGRLALYYYYTNRVIEALRLAPLAVNQTGAEPHDRDLARLTLSCAYVVSGRPDLAEPQVQLVVAHAGYERDSMTTQLLATIRWATLTQGSHELQIVDAELERLAEAGDITAELHADLLATLLEVGPETAEATTSRANELRDRALDQGNLYAAWLATLLGMMCALLRQDAPAGERLLEQAASYQQRLGCLVTPLILEFAGGFAVLGGDLDRAVALFAEARATAFAAGTSWPYLFAVQPMLQAVRDLLPADAFQSAWRRGSNAAALTL